MIKALRNAFGRSPTGVAIISTVDAEGRPVAMTANSVVPVGAARMHLIWSLGKHSKSRAAFEDAGRFGVSLLAHDQESIARQMSSAVADRFEGLNWYLGAAAGVPLINGSAARFECSSVECLEIGDHLTFIGEVVACEQAEGDPLLYVDGRYARLGNPLPAPSRAPVPVC